MDTINNFKISITIGYTLKNNLSKNRLSPQLPMCDQSWKKLQSLRSTVTKIDSLVKGLNMNTINLLAHNFNKQN